MSTKITTTANSNLHAELKKDEDLKAAISELDTFFYRASHDLRTPIVALEGIYNMLNSSDEFAKHPALGLLKKQVIKIKGLNESIIDVGTVRSKSLDIQPVNLLEATNSTCIDLLADSLATLNIHIPSDIYINTDPLLLDSILVSFIHNALNYRDSSKEPSMVISATENEGTLLWTVEDNGLGINELLMPKLFSMFFRANVLKTGFGLSLYKSKIAAQRLNLTLEVESVEFQGTKASILFPEFFKSL